MALTQQQLAELAAWVDQYAAATERLSAQTSAAVIAAYSGVNYYNAVAVAAAAEQAADTSNTAALIAAGLAAQYLGLTTSQILGSAVGVPNLPLPPLRNGVPLPRVFERVAKFYRRKVSQGVPADRALEQALRLATTLADTNVRLAERDASRQILTYLAPRVGIEGYRRVVRPELSRTGTCGLCLVASDQRYNVADLMPLHANCKCVVLPIIGDIDPGSSLNNLSLGDVYDAAGGTTAGRALKKVRYRVNDHGELGPVLTNAAHKFTSADQLEGYDPSSGSGTPSGGLPLVPGGGSGAGGGQPPAGGTGGGDDGGSGDDGFRARALAQLGPPPAVDAGEYWGRRKSLLPAAFHPHGLEPREVEFIERMLDAGEQIEWITNDPAMSTNDFTWRGRPFELKSTQPKASSIRGRILDAASRAMRNHGVVKENFVIDLGDAVLSDAAKQELAGYNVGRQKYRIAELWVMSGGVLEQIPLRT